MKNNYQILRVYNNNAILVLNQETLREAVLVGKGIGFAKKVGECQTISPNQVEKYFLTYDDTLKSEYLSLVEQLDEQVLTLCSEIILHATQKLGPLNQRIHIVLTDHIGFALERMKSGMEIYNPFLVEIRTLYPEEFEMGKYAQEVIKNTLGIEIVEDEVAFIALHLSAARQQKDVKESVKSTRVIKALVEIVEQSLNLTIPKDLTYTRLIQHLRSTIERMLSGHQVENPLLTTLKKELKESFEIALLLKTKIESSYEITVPEDEVGFIAIHIDRLKRSINQ